MSNLKKELIANFGDGVKRPKIFDKYLNRRYVNNNSINYR